MNESRFAKAVADLRQWVNEAAQAPLTPGQARAEIFRLAADIADSLGESEEMTVLVARAQQFRLATESQCFQQMFDLARYCVIRLWRAAGSQTDGVARIPDDVVVNDEGVDDWTDLLPRLAAEPAGPSPDKLPYSHRLEGIEGRSITASIISDLRFFIEPMGGVIVGHNVPALICRLERVATFFECATNVGQTATVTWACGRLRHLISYFCEFLNWADHRHERGSYLMYGCLVYLRLPDAVHNSALFGKWLETFPKHTAKIILEAAESLTSGVGGDSVIFATATRFQSYSEPTDRTRPRPGPQANPAAS